MAATEMNEVERLPTFDIALALAITVGAMPLFATGRLRVGVVALAESAALVLIGLVSSVEEKQEAHFFRGRAPVAMAIGAAVVLTALLAISTAAGFGVDPKPFLLAITFAASAASATLVRYQTNTTIYSPGGYVYSDYIKVGIPVNLIFFVLAVLLNRRLWLF